MIVVFKGTSKNSKFSGLIILSSVFEIQSFL